MTGVDFYQRHYTDMLPPMLAMMRHGVRVDTEAAAQQHVELQAECVAIQNKLAELAGVPLHAKADLSNAKVQRFLYDDLQLPKQRRRGTTSVTADEVALRRLQILARRQAKLGPAKKSPARWKQEPALAEMVVGLIMQHRKTQKRSTFLKPENIDPDGRLRCQYKFTTQTGRLASSSNPMGTGLNLQNIQRDVRHLFIPDEGCVFLEVDLSQAEDRVVKVLSGDPDMIARARMMPWDNDEHVRAAAAIFGVPAAEVTKLQRYLGKRTRHATNYGMRGNKLAEILLKDDLVRTPEECEEWIDKLLAADPAIKEWHRATCKQVIRTRKLSTSWGREIEFTYDRFDDDLYRRAYAFVPQSEVGDLLNQYGLIPLHKFIQLNSFRSRINLQVHDALVVSCIPEELWLIMDFVKSSLERTRLYGRNKVELMIPAEFKLGRSWKGDIEWKKMPTRKEVEQAAASMMKWWRPSTTPTLNQYGLKGNLLP